jgi:dolichol-phosphate mannosyltransferase
MCPFDSLFIVSLLGVYNKMKYNKPCLVTLIIPAYNESESIIDSLKEILKNARKAPDVDYELLLIDDGSNDDTGKKVEIFSRIESAINLISFTRNFGKEAAIQAGMENAKGSAVIIMDADLQHPPELIPEMIRLWRAGMPVVETVKQDRGQESIFKKMQVKLFYQIFKWFAGIDIEGLSDYKLLDRKVINLYLKWPEKDRFFRGLISWAQFPSARLPFKVSHSTRNRSKWSRLKLVSYAVNNISNFSAMPLHIFSIIGVAMLVFGISIGAISLYQKLIGHAIGGFTTVNLLIILIGGTQLLGLGIIGHYIVKIYQEVKGRPSYIINSDVEVSDNDQ